MGRGQFGRELMEYRKVVEGREGQAQNLSDGGKGRD